MPLVKVHVDIIIDLDYEEQVQDACATLDGGLLSRISDFPNGDIVDVRVEGYDEVSDDEAESEGWVE